ncbi:conserved hypothetical protein [Candidatus Sulfotelmatobacter kueseliae]|uniref:Uncharacterized protein n=1 Tax=Candidatus Sulfotelmatobacter kueseliae TaxID=2042962 RepID=A0A2U3KNQ9_9BACT|nr:conserved hypothetical protein [Candidatus Sulfotelmatobacter kueseliae]
MNFDKDTNRMEDALKNALRRREAPEGFADRVLTRVAERSSATPVVLRHQSWLRLFAQPLVRGAAATAVCAALVVGGIHYRNVQREHAEGKAAKQQLILALRIAGSKLQLAKSKINEINVNHVPADQTGNQEEKE